MSTQSPPPEGERRRAARQKSLLSGRIQYGNGRHGVDCVIRDISAHGARLVFPDSITTPDVMDLWIPQKDQTLKVHVIWSSGREIGVAFEQAASQAPGAGPGDEALAERLSRLEAEVATLRRLLKRLKADIENEDAA